MPTNKSENDKFRFRVPQIEQKNYERKKGKFFSRHSVYTLKKSHQTVNNAVDIKDRFLDKAC
jgi:hypothetical protein